MDIVHCPNLDAVLRLAQQSSAYLYTPVCKALGEGPGRSRGGQAVRISYYCDSRDIVGPEPHRPHHHLLFPLVLFSFHHT